MDGGVLGLDRVYELISEGETLPVSCAEELKVTPFLLMAYVLLCFWAFKNGFIYAVTWGSKHALLHLQKTI